MPGHQRHWQQAVATSLALHGAVLASVGGIQWTSSPAPESDPLIVWLYEQPPLLPIEIDVSHVEPLERRQDPLPEFAPEPDPADPPVADEPLPPEPVSPAEEADDVRSFPNRSRIERSIDWEAEKSRAVFYLRDEIDRTEAYLTFAYPQRPREPSLFSDVDSVTIPGVDIRPRPSLCRSIGWTLARVLLPSDICDWRKRDLDSPLTEEQRNALILPALPEGNSYVDRSILARP